MSSGNSQENKVPAWNLIGRIRQAREKDMRQMEEAAAAEVTDAMAENKRRIMDTLCSIDFIRSKLPRTEPGGEPAHPKHTVDYYMSITKYLCSDLAMHPDSAPADLRELDKKILVLSKMFKKAVEDGCPMMAEMSRVCLARAVGQVREGVCREPDVVAADADIKAAESLVDRYIEITGAACEVDLMEENIALQSVQLEQEQEKIHAIRDRLFQYAKEDRTVNEALVTLLKNETDHEETALEGQLRSIVMDQYLNERKVKLLAEALEEDRRRARTARAQCKAMLAFNDAYEIISLDPDRMKRYEERVQQFMESMPRVEAE